MTRQGGSPLFEGLAGDRVAFEHYINGILVDRMPQSSASRLYNTGISLWVFNIGVSPAWRVVGSS